MCEHEELLDCGEYVCIKCGVVLGQEYILEEKSFKQQLNENKDPATYSRGAKHLQIQYPYIQTNKFEWLGFATFS